MAKVSFSSLKLKVKEDIEEIYIGDKKIEVKTYISTEELNDMIQAVVEQSTTSTIYNDFLGNCILADYIIDYSWTIKEDGEIYYEGNTYPVVAGDVVFLLYANYKNDAVNRELVIVHSDKFTEVVGKNIEYENEQRKKKCCDCENCETCCGKC